MRSHTKKEQHAVADILPGLARQNGWELQLDLHSIFGKWDAIADPDTAEHSRPLKISRGILWIEVDNSAWLQQLRYMKYQLLESINSSLRQSRIEDIKYVLPKGRGAKPEADKGAVRFVPPPVTEIDRFKSQISFIGDEQCREALFRFWYLARACRKD